MISCSSSFASSTPATSLNVTFFCADEESFALLLPNDSALLPPLCIWRMKKIQNPMSSRIGAHEYSRVAQGLAVGSLAFMRTPFSTACWRGPRTASGACVWNVSFDLSTPLMSLPVIVTLDTWPASTCDMKVLKLMACSRDWNVREKFHTRSPTKTSTIQNSRLLRVEFTRGLPTDG